jgi:16S rRNA pseudouridine516 synthase
MRLDKYISQVTDHSRAEVKQMLRNNWVSINDETIRSAAYQVKEDERVCIDGEEINQPGPRYFMLHKPQGYICATKDKEHPVALELLDEPNVATLQIAGRLDLDTTGLVLITDDGKWNHAITSPKRDCKKTYYVCTDKKITDETTTQFAEGLMLDGEIKLTQPAKLEILLENECNLTLSEGKYHQVKRMFGAVGNRVAELHRHTIGGIKLDETLEPGEYRPLTQEEIDCIER